MRFLYTLPLRFRSLFRRNRVEQELADELSDYIAHRTEQEIAAGATPEQARRIAERALGGIELRKEECRDTRRTQWMEQLAQDLRYGWRSLRSSPTFTVVALLSLALGIGANTAIFSVVNALLLRPLPVPEPDRLVHIRTGGSHTAYSTFDALREQSGMLQGLAGHDHSSFSLTRGDAASIVAGEIVTANYFDLTGVAPLRGRVFQGQNDEAQTAVVSYEFWQRFNGNPDFIGRQITLDGRPFTVIGIMPEGFHGTFAWGVTPSLWIPAPRETGHSPTMLQLVGRLKPGNGPEQVQAELAAIASRLEQFDPDRNARLSQVEVMGLSGIASFDGISSAPAIFLFLAFLILVSAMVLAIACANVASLLLARAAVRRREIATRMTLGAGRGRVIRQLLTESALLSVLGSAVGILVAQGLPKLFPLILRGLPVELRIDVAPDWRVLSYTLLVSLLSATFFGLKPALDATRGQASAILKNAPGLGGRGRFHLRGLLVAGQLAVSFALLIAGGLFMRSLSNVQTAEPGFDVEHGITAALLLPPERYGRQQSIALFDRLLERMRAVPGVSSASFASIVPLSLNNTRFGIWREGDAPGPGTMVYVNAVAPDYFRTLSIPLLRGRDFSARDRDATPRVAIVNETLARRLWPEGAVGKRIRAGRNLSLEIAGVVQDSKYMTLGEEPRPVLYTSFFQEDWPSATLHVRTIGSPGPLLAPVKREIQQLDPWLAVELRTMRDNLESGFGPARLGAALLGLFGLAALLLASVGVFGLVAYAVSRRAREIGIRIALGASKADVLRLVIADGMILCGAGLAVGMGLAFALTSAIRSFLVGVEPADPATFGAILALLAGVALLASYLPARRSLRINPSVTLRQE